MKRAMMILPLLTTLSALGCDVGVDPRDQRDFTPGKEARGLELRADLGTVGHAPAVPQGEEHSGAAEPGKSRFRESLTNSWDIPR